MYPSISHLICVIFLWPAGTIHVTACNIPNMVPKCEAVHMYIYPFSGLNTEEDISRIKIHTADRFLQSKAGI